LNLKSFIQPSEILPVKLTRTHNKTYISSRWFENRWNYHF